MLSMLQTSNTIECEFDKQKITNLYQLIVHLLTVEIQLISH